MAQRAAGRLGEGQILWFCATPHGHAGVAWDWLEVRERVVAMSDPMSVVSNLQFVDENGRAIVEGARLIELHHLIASLPWQQHVLPRAPALPMRMAA